MRWPFLLRMLDTISVRNESKIDLLALKGGILEGTFMGFGGAGAG